MTCSRSYHPLNSHLTTKPVVFSCICSPWECDMPSSAGYFLPCPNYPACRDSDMSFAERGDGGVGVLPGPV